MLWVYRPGIWSKEARILESTVFLGHLMSPGQAMDPSIP